MKIAVRVLMLTEASLRDFLKKKFKVDDNAFERADPKHSSNSIIKTKNGYAGFSRRAVAEFIMGDMLFDSNAFSDMEEEELDKMPFKKRGTKKIQTMDDAKQAAINFARYVS